MTRRARTSTAHEVMRWKHSADTRLLPYLSVDWLGSVEDGAELDVAGAAEEIELSNWVGTGLTTSRRRLGTRLGEKGPRSWSRIQSSRNGSAQSAEGW